jgi:uncharacterized protein YcbK (DUF882 family)
MTSRIGDHRRGPGGWISAVTRRSENISRSYGSSRDLRFATGRLRRARSNDACGEIDVIWGYCTLWSNEFLRTRSSHAGVALHSLHMEAEAIDIRFSGIPATAVRDAALRREIGGVGYYRDSNFVHADVGRVRRW